MDFQAIRLDRSGQPVTLLSRGEVAVDRTLAERVASLSRAGANQLFRAGAELALRAGDAGDGVFLVSHAPRGALRFARTVTLRRRAEGAKERTRPVRAHLKATPSWWLPAIPFGRYGYAAQFTK